MPPAAPTPLDLRLAQALVQRGLLRAEHAAALHAAGVAQGLTHSGSPLLGAAVAQGLISASQAEELVSGVRGPMGPAAPETIEVEPPAGEVPALERALAQVLVHRGLLAPLRLPELFERARGRGRRHGGSLLAAAAIEEGLLTPATADLLLRALVTAGGGPAAAGGAARMSAAAEADALIDRALTGRPRLPDADPRDVDALIDRALAEAHPPPARSPNAPRQPVALRAPLVRARPGPPTRPGPGSDAPPSSAPTMAGGFGLDPGAAPTMAGGLGLDPGAAPTMAGFGLDPGAAPTLPGFGLDPGTAPTLPGFGLAPQTPPHPPVDGPPGGAATLWDAPQDEVERREPPPAGAGPATVWDGGAEPVAPGATRWEAVPAPPAPAASNAPAPDATRWEPLPAGPGGGRAPDRGAGATEPALRASGADTPADATGWSPGQAAPRVQRRGRAASGASPSAGSLLEGLFAGERYQPLGGEALGPCRALDRRLRREVVLHRPVVAIQGPSQAEQLLREAHLLAQLDHPAIPRVHDIGLREGLPFFATDPLPGQRLSERPDAGALPRLPALLRAFLGVAAAVEHAHRVGLAHGELAPSRVVLGELGQVWVDGWARAAVLPSASECVRAAARAQPPPAPPGPAVLVAPETRGGRAPDVRADVWGLGAILAWILGRQLPAGRGDPLRGIQPGVPAELLAIARRALAPAPRARYPGAHALLEDVRAYLDGRSVSAAPETVVSALRRLARRNPGAAGIALAGGAALLLLVGLTLVSVRRDWRRAEESAGRAREEQDRAERLGRLAALRLEVARRRSAGEIELTRARAGTGDDAEVLRRFTAAEEAARAAAASEERAEAMARELGAPAAGAPPADLARRARRLRGEWALRAASSPRPLERALEDWQALARLDPRDAEAQLGAFLVARRLPGARAGAEEAAALELLADLPGPLGELARAETALRGGDPAQALELVKGAITARPDLPLAWEVRGRARLLQAGRGHVSQKREGGLVDPGLGDLLHAARLDPRDPFPRLALLREWNEAYGLHQPWRYEVLVWVGELELAGELTARLEPPLELARYRATMNQAAGSLPLLERALGRLPAEPRAEERPQLAELRLLHLRALLAARRPTREALLALPAADQLPAPLRAPAAALRAHAALLEGGQPAAEALQAALKALQQPGGHVAWPDLFQALADDRADAEVALAVLGGLELPPPEDPRARDVAPLAAAMLHAGARLPEARLQPVLGRLDQLARWLARLGAFGWQMPDPRLTPARLGHARLMLRLRPDAPEAGVGPLLVWAGANHIFPLPPGLVAEAQELLQARARAVGSPERAWSTEPPATSPTDEVWVPRVWEGR